MTAVMIGVDPHKGSHTAVAIGPAEEPLGELRVRASAAQAEQLLAWAAAWPERTWAVEGAGGLGHLLAQQLVAAGERVLDVQPKLAARVRLLAAGQSEQERPERRPVGGGRGAALARARRQVAAEDHAAVLKVWSKRHRDLGRARNQVACRLHAVLCELVPGGVARGDHRRPGRPHPGSGTAGRGGRGRPLRARRRVPGGPAPPGRPDPRVRRRSSPRRSGHRGTTPDRLFGVGPVIAGHGHRRRPRRGPVPQPRTTSPPTTAPPRSRCPPADRKIYRLSLRGNRRLNHAIHMAAITQIRHRHSDGRAYYQQETGRRQDRQRGAAVPETAGSATPSTPASRPTPGRPPQRHAKGPGGQPGNDSDSSAAGSHPGHRLFGQVVVSLCDAVPA